MEINKERIEEVAQLICDGIKSKLTGDNGNIKVTPTEFIIALAAGTRVVLLNSFNLMKLRIKTLNITDEQLLEAFGNIMFFSIDENIKIAQKKNDQE